MYGPRVDAISTQITAERLLPHGRHRRERAEQWLGEILKVWQVRSASTGRWLNAAQEALDGAGDLVLFAQYDPALLLFSLELRRGGRAIYGIDDWLGWHAATAREGNGDENVGAAYS
ncbi:MAG: hypothetical protein NVS3B26_23570 [Mycobacteriales bacterium]